LPKAGPATSQIRIVIPDGHSMVGLLGTSDELLQVIEREFSADIHVRGNEITVSGPPRETKLVGRLFDELLELQRKGAELSPDAVERTVAMLRGPRGGEPGERPADVLTQGILSSRGRTIRPKTLNQKHYADAIDKHTIVFAVGPAGTGKTYLAMAKAVKALQAKEVNRIILTRPAVEAGERLGFLPGTLYEKIDPYLRPLYDALHDMLDPDSIPKLTAAGTIEIAPLAYMRGRSQHVATPVLTPDGWRPIGELAVGDLVIGSNGEPTPVLGVYPQGEKDIYRVTTQDGGSTLASGDHLWAVATRDDRRRGKPLRVLTTKDMIGNLRANHSHQYELPLHSAPVCFPFCETLTDPYELGLLLGGGCLAGSKVPAFAATAGVTQGGVMTAESPGCPPPETAFVPGDYLYNSAEVRLAVLQGLLDAGGTPVAQRDSSSDIRYATTSPGLRDNAIFLVRSIGGMACGRRQDPSSGYLVDIRLPEGIEPFRLQEKAAAYTHAGRPVRFIESIEPEGTAEAVCISVAAEDSLYTTEDFILTHNTLNDSFIILDEAQNTSAEQMKMFLTRLGFGSRIVVTGDVTQVDLPSGQVSGLRVVQDILEGIEDIHFARLTSHDVVRHRLVGKIVDAYEKHDAAHNGQQTNQRNTKRR
jgi:phosphate starvation-inducible PhoH-like protein